MTFKEWIGTAPIDEVAEYLDDWIYGLDGISYGFDSTKKMLETEWNDLLEEAHIDGVLRNKYNYCKKNRDERRKCYETCPLREFRKKDDQYCVIEIREQWVEVERVLKELGEWDENEVPYHDFTKVQ